MLPAKGALAITALVYGLIFAACGKSSTPTSVTTITPQVGINADCGAQLTDIRSAIHTFSSGEYEPIQQAREVLLRGANRSAECRSAIIKMLMVEMDQPGLDLEKQASNYFLWREGSELLGDLKATEALDLLISHLHLHNGYHSASQVFQPAIRGVTKIGSAAIPKLSVALQENPNSRLRLAAAYCLASIGGPSAMRILREVEESESNACVLQFIRISLDTFMYKTKSGRIRFDNEAPQADSKKRMQWLLAFQCVDS